MADKSAEWSEIPQFINQSDHEFVHIRFKQEMLHPMLAIHLWEMSMSPGGSGDL